MYHLSDFSIDNVGIKTFTMDGESILVSLFLDDVPQYYKNIAEKELNKAITEQNLEILQTDELTANIMVQFESRKYCEISIFLSDTIKKDFKLELNIPVDPEEEHFAEFKKCIMQYAETYIFE
jgi:hypothetical protein